jgi:hypothetical protein
MLDLILLVLWVQGTFERVLSYVYRNDIEINFMESDTQVNWVQRLRVQENLKVFQLKVLVELAQ